MHKKFKTKAEREKFVDEMTNHILLNAMDSKIVKEDVWKIWNTAFDDSTMFSQEYE